MNKRGMVPGMEVMHWLSNVDLHSLRWIWAQHRLWHHSLRGPAIYLVAGSLRWTTSSWKRQCFVLSGIDSCSGYGFAFLTPSVSGKTAIHGLTAFSTILVFHTASLPTKELTSQQLQYVSGPMLMAVACLTPFPVIRKQLPWQNEGLILWRLSYSATRSSASRAHYNTVIAKTGNNVNIYR